MHWYTEDIVRPFFQSIIYNDDAWRTSFPNYLKGYQDINPLCDFDQAVFSNHIDFKCLEIYLWTKNNWSGESAPGKLKTEPWLKNIYNKLIS